MRIASGIAPVEALGWGETPARRPGGGRPDARTASGRGGQPEARAPFARALDQAYRQGADPEPEPGRAAGLRISIWA